MKHQTPKRIGDNIHGTRYIFTIPLKNGDIEKIILEPKASATSYFSKGFFGNINERGSQGCWSYLDSDPHTLMKQINDGEFILCDSGKGFSGNQIDKENISCVSELCIIPMEITRQELSDSDCF